MACVPALKDRAGILDSKINGCPHLSTGGKRLSAHRGEHKPRFLSCIPEGNGGMGFPKDSQIQQFFVSRGSTKAQTKPILPPLSSLNEILLTQYIPVYVLLPVDVVKRENVFVSRELFSVNFRALKAAQVDGVRVQVWWGIVEAKGATEYDWSAYKLLFSLVQQHGLKLKVSICFHQHGGKLIDSYMIPLPTWVLKIGERDPDIFFMNKDGLRSQEYLSFGVDDEGVLGGRSAIEVYSDFMRSFNENMRSLLDSGLITEIEVGLGPEGELRYPSGCQQSTNFQFYDKYLSSKLQGLGKSSSASLAPENSWVFLHWYSKMLLEHAERVLQVTRDVFGGCAVKVGMKMGDNRPTDLSSGCYGLRENGYKSLLKILSKYKVVLNLRHNIIETSGRHPDTLRSEALVRQVLTAGGCEGVDVVLENAFPVFSRAAFDHILQLARPGGVISDRYLQRRLSGFTFSRLGHPLMLESNWREFVWFVRRMHAGLDCHPELEIQSSPVVDNSTSPRTVSSSTDTPSASIPPKTLPSQQSFFTRDAPGGGLGMQIEGDDPRLGEADDELTE